MFFFLFFFGRRDKDKGQGSHHHVSFSTQIYPVNLVQPVCFRLRVCLLVLLLEVVGDVADFAGGLCHLNRRLAHILRCSSRCMA